MVSLSSHRATDGICTPSHQPPIHMQLQKLRKAIPNRGVGVGTGPGSEIQGTASPPLPAPLPAFPPSLRPLAAHAEKCHRHAVTVGIRVQSCPGEGDHLFLPFVPSSPPRASPIRLSYTICCTQPLTSVPAAGADGERSRRITRQRHDIRPPLQRSYGKYHPGRIQQLVKGVS